MSNPWSKLNSPSAPAPSPDELLKLPDGALVVVAFLGSPFEVPTFYANGRRHMVGVGNLPPNTRVDVRVLVNAFDTRSRVVRIAELVPRVYNNLLLLQENHPLNLWTFVLSRSGVGQETKYAVCPDRPLTALERAAIRDRPLFALEAFAQELYAAPAPLSGPRPSFAEPAAVPVAPPPEYVTKIEAVLAEAGPEALADLLATFEVSAVGAIPYNRAAAAVAYANALRDEHRAAQRDAGPDSNNL